LKNYLSFGAGVNSVAALLVESFDEVIFCDTGCEFPETYEYLNILIAKYPITVVMPDWGNLYNYCWDRHMVPVVWPRWCTVHFKIEPFEKNTEVPAFRNLAFATDESKRARLSMNKNYENRFPLLEHDMSRQDCIRVIKEAGLPIPHRSKCYFCPFQTIAEWKELRMNHPDLFCKAEKLEARNREYRISKGKKPLYLYGNARSLKSVVDERQTKLFAEDLYPPCECML
jgi:hypothetical protein